jgi:tetratricopeptide (TPR) repeat protein
MRFKFIFAFAFALLLSVSATTAHAQTAQVTGKVTLRQADGTEVPVQDALVTFHRTDISGKYEVKTNKKGEYVRLGMPYGTFLIVVSAPNARPTFSADVNVGRKPDNNFVLSPGDGRVLTLAEAKAAAAPQTATAGGEVAAGGGGAAAAKPVDNAEARRLAAEEAKKIAEIEAKNARATELNTKLPEILKAGNAAFSSKNYAEAITAYDQGIAADPEQGVFHLNKALALRERGVSTFNTATKAKDQAGRNSAKADIKASVESLEKAVAAYRGAGKTPQTGAAAVGGGSKSTEMLSATRERAESYRIAMLVGLSELAEPASVAVQEYIDTETDQAQKAKFEITLANALRDSGQTDKAVAIYRRRIAANQNDMDATFGLGMALQFDEAKLVQNAPEVINLMKQVLAKGTAADHKQAATDSIASMESILQQSKPNAEAKPRNSRRRN